MADLEDVRMAEEDANLQILASGKFRLSREERDYIAGHALDSIHGYASELKEGTGPEIGQPYADASDDARKIAALSNLLGDIGWEREAPEIDAFQGGITSWPLGELFPVAQLRPWLEEWQRQDNEALTENERNLEVLGLQEPYEATVAGERNARSAIAVAQTKLGTGAILLARIEKWMASHVN